VAAIGHSQVAAVIDCRSRGVRPLSLRNARPQDKISNADRSPSCEAHAELSAQPA